MRNRYRTWSTCGTAARINHRDLVMAAGQARAITREGLVACVDRGALGSPVALVTFEDGEYVVQRHGGSALSGWMVQLEEILAIHG